MAHTMHDGVCVCVLCSAHLCVLVFVSIADMRAHTRERIDQSQLASTRWLCRRGLTNYRLLGVWLGVRLRASERNAQGATNNYYQYNQQND